MPRDIELKDDYGQELDTPVYLDRHAIRIGTSPNIESFTLDLDTATTLHAWLGEYIREELTK